jgi:Flp pilus assembly protein TadB
MLTQILVVVSCLIVFGVAWADWIGRREFKQRQERERFQRIAQANSESRERIVPRASGLRGDHRRVS